MKNSNKPTSPTNGKGTNNGGSQGAKPSANTASQPRKCVLHPREFAATMGKTKGMIHAVEAPRQKPGK